MPGTGYVAKKLWPYQYTLRFAALTVITASKLLSMPQFPSIKILAILIDNTSQYSQYQEPGNAYIV